jgi:uncharacterized membrane protein YgcG
MEADFDGQKWDAGKTFQEFVLDVKDKAEIVIEPAQRKAKIYGVVGRELHARYSEWARAASSMGAPYQLDKIKNVYSSIVLAPHNKQIEEFVDQLRGDTHASEWKLVCFTAAPPPARGGARAAAGVNTLEQITMLAISATDDERAQFSNAFWAPTDDQHQGWECNCTNRSANMDVPKLVAVGLLPAEICGVDITNLALYDTEVTEDSKRAGGRPGPCALCALWTSPPTLDGLRTYIDVEDYQTVNDTAPFSNSHSISGRPIDNFPNEIIRHWPPKCNIAKRYIAAKVQANPELKVHLGLVIGDEPFKQMINEQRPPAFRRGGGGGGRGGGGKGKGGKGFGGGRGGGGKGFGGYKGGGGQ